MPLYVFQTTGNPILRLLGGLATLAIIGVLAFFMLPVVLTVIGIVLLLGLVLWGWLWFQSKKNGDPAEQVRRAMERAEAAQRGYRTETTERREEGYSQSSNGATRCRIETSDNKKWKMDDVEDIEEKK